MGNNVKIHKYMPMVDYLIDHGFKDSQHPFENNEFILESFLFDNEKAKECINNIATSRVIINKIKHFEEIGIPRSFWFNKFLSSLEIEVAEFLHRKKIEFISQMPICDIIPIKKCRFTVDFYLPKFDYSIEIDGDYWHSLKNKINWDKRKDSMFKKFNKTILHIKESDIKNKQYKNRILSLLKLKPLHGSD